MSTSIALPKIQSIVVGTDFSPPAERVVELAADISAQTGATLMVVHAVDPMLVTLEVATPTIMRDVREGLSGVEQKLKPWGITVKTQMRMGKPWFAIAEAAKEAHADLVMVASIGRSGLARLALGSTADRVVRLCEQPVMLLPTGRDDTPVDLRRPSQWSCAIVGIDLSTESIAAASYAAALLESSSAQSRTLVLFHTIALEVDVGGMAATAMPERWEKAEANARIEMAELERKLETEHIAVETVIYRGCASDGLLAEIKSRNADFIAVGTHGRGALNRFLLGSVAERIVRSASCPVLTVRHKTGT